MLGTRNASVLVLTTATVLVALVAIRAGIYVSAHIRMSEIRRVVIPMASSALEDGIITRVRMAGCAHAICIPVICREVRMVEGGSCPRRGGVARVARRREARRRVVRIRGPVVIRLMAAVAGSRQRRVVVVHVATIAGHTGVRAGQRECRRAVIERCARPCRCAVAGVAGGREAYLRVNRVIRIVVIRLVA